MQQRSGSTAQTRGPPRPLTPLSYLSSPVPDFASTLHTQAADAADEENVSFLRDSLDSLDRATQTEPHATVDPARDPRLRHPDAARTRLAAQWSRSEPTTAGGSSSGGGSSGSGTAQRERLQRYLSRLYQSHSHNPPGPSANAYSDRTPSPNRQSLYDWAPAYEQQAQDTAELDAIVDELRRDRGPDPDAEPDMSRPEPDHGDAQRDVSAGNGPGQDELYVNESGELRRRIHIGERYHSIRNRQRAARQEGSPSATERMLRYFMDRERSGLSEEEERARGTGWYRPQPSRAANEESRNSTLPRDHWLLPPRASEVRERDRQERVEAFRRGYLAEHMPPSLPRISTPPATTSTTTATYTTSSLLENALKYLNDLRHCDEYEDALAVAIDYHLATKEFFADKHDEFILDLTELAPPSYTSWLQPGAVFHGHQHASSPSVSVTRNRPSSSTRVVEQINPQYRPPPSTNDIPPGSTRVAAYHPPPTTTTLPSNGAPPLPSPAPRFHFANLPSTALPPSMCKLAEPLHDHWPVRVIIHSVDQDKMLLQGTMEAYDVPQHPAAALGIQQPGDRPKAGRKSAPITTYLEGHIIDGRTHSFLTPSSCDRRARGPTAADDAIAFPAASAAIDAANWRKLPPFSELASDRDMARLLLSRARLDALAAEYVFMRWKERCFVHARHDACPEPDRRGDRDRGHGLTISGFYYVSMRRSDGLVEGLYFDPTSTPYQHLRLTGLRAMWPSWGFR